MGGSDIKTVEQAKNNVALQRETERSIPIFCISPCPDEKWKM